MVDQMMFRVNMFTSANEQMQTFLFSVHGGGLVAALAFLSSKAGEKGLAWLPEVIGLLVLGVFICGSIRVLGYFVTMALAFAMRDAIRDFDNETIDASAVVSKSLPKHLIWVGGFALALGVVNFLLFLAALNITVKQLLLPQL